MSFQREPSRADASLLDFWPPELRETHFFSKPAGVGPFVTAALGNDYRGKMAHRETYRMSRGAHRRGRVLQARAWLVQRPWGKRRPQHSVSVTWKWLSTTNVLNSRTFQVAVLSARSDGILQETNDVLPSIWGWRFDSTVVSKLSREFSESLAVEQRFASYQNPWVET